MGKKKGLSFDEKRQRILQIYYDKKEAFKIQEIEKIGAKKGVTMQTIKDVNKSLADDNLIETDKIGSGSFFWSLPSKGYNLKKNMIDKYLDKIEETKKSIEATTESINAEKVLREDSDQTRDDKKAQLLQLKAQIAEKQNKITLLERTDPKKVKEVQDRAKVAKEAANRWTDNIFEIRSWILKKNPNFSGSDLEKQFPILKDLDNIE
ncbi:unnamed protein product [Moneuplotes crassus]|uniref:Meiotic nuclear division protein 1 homolog n=1 Tax=Euplotes crassus TaxID=5936 RepID=A0AAD2D3N3_EUPCR|nr:unnamed protein product [Moneuplotes crassus]